MIIAYYILMEQGKATAQVSYSWLIFIFNLLFVHLFTFFSGKNIQSPKYLVCLFIYISKFAKKFCYEQDLDLRCEDLIKEEFGQQCNFDVVDAVQKLERLGIVSRVSFFENVSHIVFLAYWLLLLFFSWTGLNTAALDLRI